MTIRIGAMLAAAMLAAILGLSGASGQSTFTGPAAPAPRTATEAPSFIERLSAEIRVRQQAYYRSFGEAIRALKAGYSGEAGLALVMIAFAYGVFHAAGPGHGKAVISAYMLANEQSLRRGIVLSALAALAQALTAIVAVYGFILVLGAAGRSAQLLAGDLEVVSFAMIVAIGLWLTWRSAAPLFTGAASDHGHAHGHGHHGDNGHDHADHSHMPNPASLDRRLTLSAALPIIASIGIRPCSGAIVILIFAHTLGLYVAGIAATLAMAAGTAITVAVLASLALASRDLAIRIAGRRSRTASFLYRAAAIAGSLAVLALGLILLHGSLTTPISPFS